MESLLGLSRDSNLAGLDYNFGELDRLGLTGTAKNESSPMGRGPSKACDACRNMNAKSLNPNAKKTQHSSSCDIFEAGAEVEVSEGDARNDTPVPLCWIMDAGEEPRSHYPFPYVFTRSGDPAMRYGIPAVKTIQEDLQPDMAAGFIQACIKRDDELHDDVLPNLPASSSQPGRLIDVFPDGVTSHWSEKLPVRLVSSDSWSDAGHPNYVALSHCWGRSLTKEFMTMSASLQSRLRGIHHSSLTPSFRDAVTITRSLGIRYVWIDALCIVQDSEADWVAESAKMAAIYGDSYLTIAADSSPDSFGGILVKRAMSKSINNTSRFEEISSVLSTGEQSSLLIYRPSLTLESPDALRDSVLSTRGWTFQENILSPRTIHFTTTQMVWEDRQGEFTTEDGLPFVRAMSELEEVRSIVGSGSSYSKDDLFQIWNTWLVEQNYSHRDFTYYKDRGIAIAGVARRVADQTGARYLAGLWAHSLATDLGWFRKSSKSDPKACRNSPRRPTWSWTSYDFPVAWKPAQAVVPAIRPEIAEEEGGHDLSRIGIGDVYVVESVVLDDVELECLDRSNDPFGPITSCRLHIRCDMGPCNVVKKPGTDGLFVTLPPSVDNNEDDNSEVVVALMDNDESPGSFEYIILGSTQSTVRAGFEVTLLLVKPAIPHPAPGMQQQPPIYTRVGVALVQGYMNQIAATWSLQAKKVNIILE